MAAAPIIEQILEHEAPDLHLVPDWAPEPAPPADWGPLGARGDWSDVWDWIKDHAILPEGRPITNEFLTADQVQQIVDASVGEAVKALSGFINLNASMTLQAAGLLDDAITNLSNRSLDEHAELSQRLDQVENVQRYFIDYAFPLVEHQIDQANYNAYQYGENAIRVSQAYATDRVFKPLLETIFADQQAANQRMDVQHVEAIDHANQLNARTLIHVGEVVAPVAAATKALAQWVDDCGAPMCETMGPKTDLGKLLKGLKLAATLALFAEIANLNEDRLATLIRELTSHVGGIIDTFSQLFVQDGRTIGAVITAALP